MDKIINRLQLLSETARDKKEELSRLISEKSSKARQAAGGTINKIDHDVRENPWLYLGGVAAVSALLGFVMGFSKR